MQRQPLLPRLAYQDAPKAIEFLVAAYGFEETGRFAPDGIVVYSELAHNGTIIVAVSAAETTDSATGKNTDCPVELFCEVDNVDQHHQQASEAGATIESPPKDQFWGDRSYSSRDLEGYRWIFRQSIKHVILPDHRPTA